MSQRCEEHGLATGHDGKCVLCRRSSHAPPLDASPRWRSVAATSAALAALIGAGALLWGALSVPIAPAKPAAAILDEEPQPVAVRAGAKRAKPPAPEDPRHGSMTPTTLEHAPAPVAEDDGPDDDPARVVDGRARANGASRAGQGIAIEQGRPSRGQAALPYDEKPRAREQAERAQQERQALARARKNVSIEMYSTRTCGYCTAARRYLDGKGYSYREHDIDSDSQAERRLRALNPRGGVPTFDIDGKAVAGFNPEHLEWVIDYQAKKRLNRF